MAPPAAVWTAAGARCEFGKLRRTLRLSWLPSPQKGGMSRTSPSCEGETAPLRAAAGGLGTERSERRYSPGAGRSP